MKSNSTGRSIARARSLMNTNAPLSTPTSSGSRPGVVGGDLLAELARPVPARSSSLTTTISPRSGSSRSAVATVHRRRPYRAARDRPALRRRSRRRCRSTRRPSPISVADRVAPSDREHPLDRRGVGRVAVRRASAAAARAASRAAARPRSARRIGRVDAGGELVEQVGVVARAGRPGGRAAAPTSRSAMSSSSGSTSWRTRLRRNARVVVRRVVHRPRPSCRAQRTRSRRGAGRAAGGAPSAHAGEAVEAGAAQQVEQHRLGLVVGGVAGEHVGRQRRVAGRAGPGLEVRARRRPRHARARNAAPKRVAPPPRRRRPPRSEPGRSPWSTCTAVTSQPGVRPRARAAPASRRRPTPRSVTAVPGRQGTVQRAEQLVRRARHRQRRRCAPRSSGSRLADLGERRAGSRGPPTHGRAARCRRRARPPR